jgi:protein-L-isoaspartate(D-aspartate) O-methyltransferase
VTGTTAVDADEARQLRDAMTDKLVKQGRITSAAIEAAFRTVPRHAFARPGNSLEDCYHGSVVRNKKDADDVTLSSISAAWLQAGMITQTGIAPGMRVLEIGTTGYNAALIAEVTGPGGHVVTVDIDPEVAGWATAALQATGYGDRVTVLTGDGEHGAPGHGQFDAIIATAGAWDIPPSWTAQLTDNGTLVVPLRMNGVTRSIAFRKDGSHLASTFAETCGFVPMQGAGERPETFFRVLTPGGGHITLRFEDGAPAGAPLPGGILASEPAVAWSGLTIADMTPWSDAYLWLAGFARGFCRLDQAGGAQLAGGGPVMKTGWYPFAIARDGTLSYLAVRDLPDGGGVEFGAHAYGHRATEAAAALVGHLYAWDARGRDLSQDAFTYWPDGTTPPLPDRLMSAFRKRHGTATITWPAERPAKTPADDPGRREPAPASRASAPSAGA